MGCLFLIRVEDSSELSVICIICVEQDDSKIGDFVDEFERVFFQFTQDPMNLPVAVMTFMLLASCNW